MKAAPVAGLWALFQLGNAPPRRFHLLWLLLIDDCIQLLAAIAETRRHFFITVASLCRPCSRGTFSTALRNGSSRAPALARIQIVLHLIVPPQLVIDHIHAE
uniref:Putative secreted peptide n=1 Tax=Anopheles braziliensis TaxID=58242 RepID=A0A2M3ZVM8_9DIPT